jgi:ribosomal protein S1
VVSFGAFVELEDGIEALLHLTQMGDPPPQAPEAMFKIGDHLTAEIITLEPDRQRMGLSIKGGHAAEAMEAPDDQELAEAGAV